MSVAQVFTGRACPACGWNESRRNAGESCFVCRAPMGEGRDRRTGRYTHTADAPCRCGHALGKHAAACVDGMRECFEEGCTCERFRKVRASKGAA